MAQRSAHVNPEAAHEMNSTGLSLARQINFESVANQMSRSVFIALLLLLSN